MVPPLLLAISQPGHGSPTVSPCPQLPSGLAVPLTRSPVIVVKQVQEQALPQCFFLEPPSRATAGRAPSSMGPTWTLSGLQAGQLLAGTFMWRPHQPFLVHLLPPRELVSGEPSLNPDLIGGSSGLKPRHPT